LAEAKSFLERRIKELEEELATLKVLVRLLDEALSSKSFKTAMELLKEEKPISEYVLTSSSDKIPLAKFIVHRSYLRIVPLRNFRSSTSPFRSFFIDRVLEGMKREDKRKVERGLISPEEAFNYEVIEDEEGIIKEIIIRNYSNRRLSEIRGACRWTFEKMYMKERI